jgi:prepilin signal peptidase PulO-like enzyme (type II secretory pathway)
MTKFLLTVLGLVVFIAPIIFALKLVSVDTNTHSFWEFYPLFISGVLLSLVFFFLSHKVHTKQQSSL